LVWRLSSITRVRPPISHHYHLGYGLREWPFLFPGFLDLSPIFYAAFAYRFFSRSKRGTKGGVSLPLDGGKREQIGFMGRIASVFPNS
jgi:hypothetical protein